MQPREQVDTGVDVGSHETAHARRSADAGRMGRVRVRSLAARAAAALLVVLAALLALPLQAEAQTEVWSGTLTVRDLGFSEPGCSNTVSGSHCSAHLTDDDFTHDSTDYAVRLIFLRTNGQLEIEFDTDLTTATQGLTLNVDGTAFAFEDADSKRAAARVWFNSGLSWSAGDSVSLTLIEPADATLSNLVLEDNAGTEINLTPTFSTGTTRYTASVASSVSAITLTPTVNDASATVEYLNASNAAITDTDTTTPALDAPLVVGANTFKVKVTAGNTTPTTTTYRVVVTRAADTTPPSLESAEVSANRHRVTLTFDEDLEIATLAFCRRRWSLPSRSPRTVLNSLSTASPRPATGLLVIRPTDRDHNLPEPDRQAQLRQDRGRHRRAGGRRWKRGRQFHRFRGHQQFHRGRNRRRHLDRGRKRRRERWPPPVRGHARASLAEHGEGRLRDDFGRHRHRRRGLPCSSHLHPRHSGGRQDRADGLRAH